MTPSRYREEARRALSSADHAGVLPARAALFWRTHDYGLLAFHEERLDAELAGGIRRLLGSGRERAPERAACPVTLLYGLAAGGLGLAERAGERGALPGGGILLRVAGSLVCLSADPCACLAALARAEALGRERVIGRLLGWADAPGGGRRDEVGQDPGEAGGAGLAASCGRCGGLLGSGGTCLGASCVNHGAGAA
jgi:hypothetical protein